MAMAERRRKTGFNQALGARIRRRREELDLSLTDMTEKIGISKGHLSEVEHGLKGLSLWSAASIAQALGWGLDDLTENLMWRGPEGMDSAAGRTWREKP